jgi:hypothetical protein
MVDLDKLADALDAATLTLFDDSGKKKRPHLGCSVLGNECHRAVWFSYRKVQPQNKFPPRMLRLFNRGHREERSIEKLLLAAGFELVRADDKNHYVQHKVKALGGHFAGSMDFVVRGLPGDESGYYMLEAKTHNKKRFDELIKNGVSSQNHKHVVQSQLYMHLSGLKQTVYFAVCKDDDRIHMELIYYNEMLAKMLVEKADNIIKANDGVPGISQRAGWYACKFCDFTDFCFKRAIPARSCRTCVHSSPVMTGKDGEWSCRYNFPAVARDRGLAHCDGWLPNPATMPGRDLTATIHDTNPDLSLITERHPEGDVYYYRPPIESNEIPA